MPLYVADYLADTRRLSTLDHGAYLLLIMDYWQNGSLPNDDAALSRIAGLTPKEWAKVKTFISPLFKDGWRHKRIDEELAKAEQISGRRKASAERRWYKGDANASSNAEQEHCKEPCKEDARAGVSQSQPQDIIDPNGSIANLQFERDKKRLTDERVKLRELGEAWNELAASIGLPQIEEIEPGSPRERAALARIREGRDFDRVFAKIRASPFLRGDKGSSPCSFNWITNPTNYLKIVEGNYDEVRQAQRR
jgi:uncharacterized protein YdaU (DUF1376 family)